jgi:cytoskeletal protein CcmA (bactofilin family)
MAMKQMFQKTAPTVDFDMIIGENSSIEGNVQSGGSMRIDGHINGDITAEGDVIIGSSADVLGNIRAANIELSGTVEGKIHSDGMLKIHASGVLRGDIEVMSFVIDEGGAFEGMCNINTSDLPPKKAPATDEAKEADSKKNDAQDSQNKQQNGQYKNQQKNNNQNQKNNQQKTA